MRAQVATSGRQLAKNTMWNLFGAGAPLVVGIVATPVLIAALGTERYGLLTLTFLLIGYFSLFDLRLGRTITKFVAERLGAGQREDIAPLIWTALVLMTTMGVIGGLIIAWLSPLLVTSVLKVPSSLHSETLRAFSLLALGIPMVIVTTGLRGVLEAYQRFGVVNVLRVGMGVFTSLGPLLVLPLSHSLHAVVAVLVGGRFLFLVSHVWLCLSIVPPLRRTFRVDRLLMKSLLGFGGWLTVSSIVGPVMVYFDRFLIGALVSASAVAYYAAPYAVVTRLFIIPVALNTALFPMVSSVVVHDRIRVTRLFERGIYYVFLAVFPIVLLLVAFANEALTLWLGAEFANHSRFVLQWFAVGVLVSSLARLSWTVVQGAGRPDLGAKIHLVELPLYVVALWWAVTAYGIQGAAVVWVVRAGLDTLVFFAVVRWVLPEVGPVIRRVALLLGLGIGSLIVIGVVHTLLVKIGLLTVILALLVWLAWHRLLTTDDKRSMAKWLRVMRYRWRPAPGYSE
jgi:O-antigen/teichoic acid export membrane protein